MTRIGRLYEKDQEVILRNKLKSLYMASLSWVRQLYGSVRTLFLLF